MNFFVNLEQKQKIKKVIIILNFIQVKIMETFTNLISDYVCSCKLRGYKTYPLQYRICPSCLTSTPSSINDERFICKECSSNICCKCFRKHWERICPIGCPTPYQSKQFQDSYVPAGVCPGCGNVKKSNVSSSIFKCTFPCNIAFCEKCKSIVELQQTAEEKEKDENRRLLSKRDYEFEKSEYDNAHDHEIMRSYSSNCGLYTFREWYDINGYASLNY